MESIPNELLIAILKLAADSPLSRSSDVAPPTPICASSVDRHWRAVALSTTELWTTIRISDCPHSLRWAALFASRSGTHRLDISIDLAKAPDSVDTVGKVLSVLSPHLARWRTLAFRASLPDTLQFRDFLSTAPRKATARLESLHLSCIDEFPYNLDSVEPLQLVGLQNLRTFKTNGMFDLPGASQMSWLRVLDIDLRHGQTNRVWDQIEHLLSTTLTLHTLVIRSLCPNIEWQPHSRIVATGLRSLAVSFRQPLYSWWEGLMGRRCAGFETFTSLFALPNLERLEIVGGFGGGMEETRYLEAGGNPDPGPGGLSFIDPRLLAGWNPTSWLPCLRELRLDNVRFTPANLAFIQSFTRGITHLELVYTSGNEHLLNADLQWPAVRELIVEAFEEDVWFPKFVDLRAGYLPFDEVVVTVLPSEHRLALNHTPAIRYLCDGPSMSLFDGSFFMNASTGLVEDFERVDPVDGEEGEELTGDATGDAVDADEIFWESRLEALGGRVREPKGAGRGYDLSLV